MKQHVYIVALLVALVLCPVLGEAAGRVFYEGFEDGTTNQWTTDDYRNRCLVVTSSQDSAAGPFAGTYMASCNSNGTMAWNSPAAFETLVLASVSYTNEIFYRLRERVDTNVDRTSSSPLKFFRIYGTGANPDMFEVVQSTNGCSNRGSGATYWGEASGDNTCVSTGWHTIEYYINHTTGQLKVWHDNVLIRDDTGASSSRWYPLYILSNWSDAHDASNHMYFDNVEIFSDTGTGSTGSMVNGDIEAGTSPVPSRFNPKLNLRRASYALYDWVAALFTSSVVFARTDHGDEGR